MERAEGGESRIPPKEAAMLVAQYLEGLGQAASSGEAAYRLRIPDGEERQIYRAAYPGLEPVAIFTDGSVMLMAEQTDHPDGNGKKWRLVVKPLLTGPTGRERFASEG